MEEGKCPKCGHYNLNYEEFKITLFTIPGSAQTVVLQEKNGMN